MKTKKWTDADHFFFTITYLVEKLLNQWDKLIEALSGEKAINLHYWQSFKMLSYFIVDLISISRASSRVLYQFDDVIACSWN